MPGLGEAAGKEPQKDQQHLRPEVNTGLFRSFNTSSGPETEKKNLILLQPQR